MSDMRERFEKRDRLISLLDGTVTCMEQMVRDAVDDKGEERAFTAVEQNEFDELTKVGNILKKLILKHDLSPKDKQALFRSAFIGGK